MTAAEWVVGEAGPMREGAGGVRGLAAALAKAAIREGGGPDVA